MFIPCMQYIALRWKSNIWNFLHKNFICDMVGELRDLAIFTGFLVTYATVDRQ